LTRLPVQFQQRDFEYRLALKPGEEAQLVYHLRPVERGRYAFGVINLFLSSRLGLLERRIPVAAAVEVPVYPSILQMRQLELRALDRIAQQPGIKKIRRIGHSYEFEQIKNYVRGDDYRSVNWKASSRRGALMVNQYEDERSQQIYCVIDKSRVMKMPFEGLSLMDYAINSCLAISNIALKKYDRAGLITFSDKIGATVKADSKAKQLNKLLDALYKEQERPVEANYELLYYAARPMVTTQVGHTTGHFQHAGSFRGPSVPSFSQMCCPLVHVGGPNRASGGHVAPDAWFTPYWRCGGVARETRCGSPPVPRTCLRYGLKYLATPQRRNVSRARVVRNVNHQVASPLMIARADAAIPLRTLKMSSGVGRLPTCVVTIGSLGRPDERGLSARLLRHHPRRARAVAQYERRYHSR
jgi:hypothetical protein